jgi:hypothetical protein
VRRVAECGAAKLAEAPLFSVSIADTGLTGITAGERASRGEEVDPSMLRASSRPFKVERKNRKRPAGVVAG